MKVHIKVQEVHSLSDLMSFLKGLRKLREGIYVAPTSDFLVDISLKGVEV